MSGGPTCHGLLAEAALALSGARTVDEALRLAAEARAGIVDVDDPDSEAALAQLAELAAGVVDGLEARRRAERTERHARALERVGRAIASRLDLEEVVQLATDAATELTGAQFGAFFYNVVDDRGEAYTLYTLSGVPRSAFEQFPMPRNTAVFGPTFRGEAVVRLADVTADPRYGRNPPYHGMPEGHLPVRSYLAAPVKTSDGEVAGGLFFAHAEPGVFDELAEEVATGIAAQAAVAIVNARLYEAARRELAARERALEDHAQVARVLQASLLPPTLPEIPGLRIAARYRPGASSVGGDFYDVLPLGDGAWGLMIGDVCGQGPEAAARTALTRHAIGTAAILERQPATVLAIANEALLRDGDERFTTALFARLTARAGRLAVTLATAGHPAPLILDADGRVEAVDAQGSLLGVLEDLGASDRTVELRAGETIVFYTDGLAEARRDGEVFGDERLRQTLAGCGGQDPDELADCLLAVTDEFAARRHADDVALVVVQVAA